MGAAFVLHKLIKILPIFANLAMKLVWLVMVQVQMIALFVRLECPLLMEFVHVQRRNILTLLAKPAEIAILHARFVQLQELMTAKLVKIPLRYKVMEAVNVLLEHI